MSASTQMVDFHREILIILFSLLIPSLNKARNTLTFSGSKELFGSKSSHLSHKNSFLKNLDQFCTKK